jgi:two-component system chemotaxis response regulator CheB
MPSIAQTRGWQDKVVLVGASTGGVEALEQFLSSFPRDCPPTLITQHMPAQFLISFATRLNGCCAPDVRLARDGSKVQNGRVFLAPGGDTHMELSADGSKIVLRKGPKMTGHRPSVDALFGSAVPQAGRVVSVILTGMGSDGAQGMLALKRAGAYCIAQNEVTSVVYGMPRVARDLGAVDVTLPLTEIAPHVLNKIAVKSEVRA